MPPPSRVTGGIATAHARDQLTHPLSPFWCRNWSGDNVTTPNDTLAGASAPRSPDLGSGQVFPILRDGRRVSSAVSRMSPNSPRATSCPLSLKEIFHLKKATLDLSTCIQKQSGHLWVKMIFIHQRRTLRANTASWMHFHGVTDEPAPPEGQSPRWKTTEPLASSM